MITRINAPFMSILFCSILMLNIGFTQNLLNNPESGVYYYKIESGAPSEGSGQDFQLAIKLILMK